jgi:hypothetical protein
MFNALRIFQKVVFGFAIIVSLQEGMVALVRAQPASPRFTAEQQQQLDEAKKLNEQAEKLYSESKLKDASS